MYAILRTKKIKNRYHLTSASEHNLRLRKQNNINTESSHLNRILHDTLGIDKTDATSFQKKLCSHYADLGIKEKQANVLAFEYVTTASPKFFIQKNQKQIEEWAWSQIDFMKKEFGEQLKLALLHLDEKTPHLHFFVSTEVHSVKKYKNRHGECHKETWSLNSEKINPEYLSDLQSKFAQHNKIFGLHRGVPGSKRKNVPLKYFYRMVDKVIETSYTKQINELIDGVELSVGERLSMQTIRNKIREHLLPLLNHFTKQQKAFKEILKLDTHKLQVELIADQKKLKDEREDISARKAVYSEAINGRLQDIQMTEMLLEQNVMLANEIDRLRQKYEPHAVLPVNEEIRFKRDG